MNVMFIKWIEIRTKIQRAINVTCNISAMVKMASKELFVIEPTILVACVAS